LNVVGYRLPTTGLGYRPSATGYRLSAIGYGVVRPMYLELLGALLEELALAHHHRQDRDPATATHKHNSKTPCNEPSS
jgi:hypothetical protein